MDENSSAVRHAICVDIAQPTQLRREFGDVNSGTAITPQVGTPESSSRDPHSADRNGRPATAQQQCPVGVIRGVWQSFSSGCLLPLGLQHEEQPHVLGIVLAGGEASACIR